MLTACRPQKGPHPSKRTRAWNSAVPPNVYRQLTLPASSGTSACYAAFHCEILLLPIINEFRNKLSHGLYPSTVTDAGTVAAYYSHTEIWCEAQRCIHTRLPMRLSSTGCFLYAPPCATSSYHCFSCIKIAWIWNWINNDSVIIKNPKAFVKTSVTRKY